MALELGGLEAYECFSYGTLAILEVEPAFPKISNPRRQCCESHIPARERQGSLFIARLLRDFPLSYVVVCALPPRLLLLLLQSPRPLIGMHKHPLFAIGA